MKQLNWDSAGKTLIEIYDQRRVLIENHCGVLCFGDALITVKTKCGIASVTGRELRICQMNKDRMVIYGEIRSVEMQSMR